MVSAKLKVGRQSAISLSAQNDYNVYDGNLYMDAFATWLALRGESIGHWWSALTKGQ